MGTEPDAGGQGGESALARLVTTNRQGPYQVDGKSGESIYVCGCGLSDNKPFCDGTHKHTEDEDSDALYVYGRQGRVQVTP